MALVGNDLGDAIQAAVAAVKPDPTAKMTSDQEKAIFRAMGTAIVTYFKANATVPMGIPVSTTGSPSAQTGATTAPGTIT